MAAKLNGIVANDPLNDKFLVEVVKELSRLAEENSRLKQKLGNLEARRA